VDLVTTTADWLLDFGGLTVGAGRADAAVDVVARSRALAVDLRTAAATYVRATGCDGTCSACPMADVDGGRAACALATRLARGVRGRRAPADRAAIDLQRAVRAAAAAVFHCRRHAHPTGDCWFGADAGDVCGDVLAVAHRISG
jgi:hypothetical protein